MDISTCPPGLAEALGGLRVHTFAWNAIVPGGLQTHGLASIFGLA